MSDIQILTKPQREAPGGEPPQVKSPPAYNTAYHEFIMPPQGGGIQPRYTVTNRGGNYDCTNFMRRINYRSDVRFRVPCNMAADINCDRKSRDMSGSLLYRHGKGCGGPAEALRTYTQPVDPLQ